MKRRTYKNATNHTHTRNSIYATHSLRHLQYSKCRFYRYPLEKLLIFVGCCCHSNWLWTRHFKQSKVTKKKKVHSMNWSADKRFREYVRLANAWNCHRSKINISIIEIQSCPAQTQVVRDNRKRIGNRSWIKLFRYNWSIISGRMISLPLSLAISPPLSVHSNFSLFAVLLPVMSIFLKHIEWASMKNSSLTLVISRLHTFEAMFVLN